MTTKELKRERRCWVYLVIIVTILGLTNIYFQTRKRAEVKNVQEHAMLGYLSIYFKKSVDNLEKLSVYSSKGLNVSQTLVNKRDMFTNELSYLTEYASLFNKTYVLLANSHSNSKLYNLKKSLVFETTALSNDTDLEQDTLYRSNKEYHLNKASKEMIDPRTSQSTKALARQLASTAIFMDHFKKPTVKKSETTLSETEEPKQKVPLQSKATTASVVYLTNHVTTHSVTTPISSAFPTKPVTTQSVTTPIFTAFPTKPVTTQSVTTSKSTSIPTKPVTTHSVTTPISTAFPTKPVTTHSVTTLLSTAFPTKPVTTQSVTTPISTAIPTKPVTTHSVTTPISTAFPTKPVTTHSVTTSLSTAFPTKPVPTHSVTTPISTAFPTKPVTTHSVTTPISTAFPTKSVTTHSVTTPISTAFSTKPVTTHSVTTPISTAFPTKPVTTHSVTTPISTAFPTKPVKTYSVTTPISTAFPTKPVGTHSVTTPISTAFPTKPVRTHSVTTPLSTAFPTKPVRTHSVTTPISAAFPTKPARTHSVTTPISTAFPTKPVTTHSVTTPISTAFPTKPVKTHSVTTPISTVFPTKPVATHSVTTPVSTAFPTKPVTTHSVTTPISTAFSTKPVTTHSTTSLTSTGRTTALTTESADPNAKILVDRIRRGIALVSQTSSQHPLSTMIPIVCQDGEFSYTGPAGFCECALGRTGENCSIAMPGADIRSQLSSSLVFSMDADGEYTNEDRKLFQEQLEEAYGQLGNLLQIFVHQLTYNSTSNTTRLSYRVFYTSTATPDGTQSAAELTFDVANHTVPITINGNDVTFGRDTAFLETSDGTLVPVVVEVKENVCYMYNELGTCQNGGSCYENGGTARCKCPSKYEGPFCTVPVVSPATEEEILAVLFPVMAAVAGLVFMCSCCFFLCRNLTRGTDEDDSISSDRMSWQDMTQKSVILPRFHRPNWRQMIPGEEYDEEIPETYHMVLPDHDDTFGTKPTPQPSLVPATKFIKVSPYDDEYSYPSSYFGQPFRHNHTFIDDSLEPIDNSLLVVGGTQLPVAGSVDGPSFVVGNPVRPVTGDRLVFTDVPSTRDNSRYGVGPTNDAATSETFPYF